MNRAAKIAFIPIAAVVAGWGGGTARSGDPSPQAAESARLAVLSGIDAEGNKELADAWAKGRSWGAEQAEAAKRRLAADPRDLADRLPLIGWASKQPGAALEHRDLILGLVEYHAADRVGSAVDTFLEGAASDQATWAVVADAGGKRPTPRPDSAAVLANAGCFRMNRAGDDQEERRAGLALLARAHALDRSEWRWTAVLAIEASTRVFMESEPLSPEAAGEALRVLLDLEESVPPAVNTSSWFLQGDLPRAIAHAALRAGDLDQAERRARAILAAATPEALDWNFGNVVHAMHQLLGAVALRRGNVEDAKSHLLDSGRVPGSPQLNSFGPDFPLARDLLAKGEKAAVLEYLVLCAKFWESGRDRLAAWRKTIEAGGTPDFGIPKMPPAETKRKPAAPVPQPSAGKPEGLVGLWETVETSKGGIGGAMELRPDGTGSVAMVVLVTMRWTIEGSHLTMSGADMSEPVTAPLGRIEDDTWVIAGPDGKEMTKHRVGKRSEGAPPIVGVWSYSHYAGGAAYERYDADGSMSFRLRMPGGQAGKWSFDGVTLHLELDGRPKQDLSVAALDDRLALTDAKGHVTTYRFAGSTPWYPIGDGK